MIKVGIIGCGVIGSELARRIDKEIEGAKLVAVSDKIYENAKDLADSLKKIPKICSNDELIENVDLVIETAHKDYVREIAAKSFELGKDIMIMSVGGILDNLDLLTLAKRKRCKMYLPSGAIAGIDAIKAGAVVTIDSVTLNTTKPKTGLSTKRISKSWKALVQKEWEPDTRLCISGMVPAKQGLTLILNSLKLLK